MKGSAHEAKKNEQGIGLIIVILVLSFLAAVGMALMTVTSSGNRVSGNMRWQEQAYNAAETGFDAAWALLENYFTVGGWSSFEGHYLTIPTGIDDPDNPVSACTFNHVDHGHIIKAVGIL